MKSNLQDFLYLPKILDFDFENISLIPLEGIDVPKKTS